MTVFDLDFQPRPRRRAGVWEGVLQHLWRDRLAAISLVVILIYIVIALFCGLGLLGTDYDEPSIAPSECNLPPSWEHWAGTDWQGRDVLSRTLHGAKISLSVGLVVALIAIPLGALLGALAGYFGGLVDELIMWFYSTVSSIPYILLIICLSVIVGKGLPGVYLSLGLTFWVGTCRVIRGEFLKHRERDYVAAARALGLGPFRIIFCHIVPNVSHLLLINFSLLFIGAIKSEVILSYLGLGVIGEPSWGVMINDSREQFLAGRWWELTAATAAMFFLVLAFNIVADSLRDALDPHVHLTS
ncbi:MAG: ABC transporter permease [Planctomycetota bacterium]